MKVAHLLSLTLFVIFFNGCSAIWSYDAATLDGKQYLHHTVRHHGETLAIISGWYTGKIRNWSQVKKHNAKLNIHRINIGDTIRIPLDMVKRSNSLPISFVRKLNQRTVVAKAVPKEGVFPYNVGNVRGCEDLKNTSGGLEECIARIEGSLSQKGNFGFKPAAYNPK